MTTVARHASRHSREPAQPLGPVRPARSARRRSRQSRRRNAILLFVAQHSVAIALSLMFLAPFVFILLTSFMSSGQSLTGNYWPTSWHPGNYVAVFRKTDMPRYLWNTLLYAGLGTLFTIMSSVPAAYALSKLEWRGRRLTFLVIICMMLLPPQITAVPLYSMWAYYGLTGSLWPLILPTLFGDAFSIFLLRQFMLTIPAGYLDSARLDGCGEWGVLLRVVWPLARPGIAATAMFQFFYAWNDYFGPFLYTSERQDNWTISLGIASFRSLHAVAWNLVTAATILAIIPVMLVFFFAQKAFVQGVTLTGVTG